MQLHFNNLLTIPIKTQAYTHTVCTLLTPSYDSQAQTLHGIWCFLLMDAVMLSYLSQPGSTVPLPIGLQVAASIRCLVNQTQQLYSLWQMEKKGRICTKMWDIMACYYPRWMTAQTSVWWSLNTINLLAGATLIAQYVDPGPSKIVFQRIFANKNDLVRNFERYLVHLKAIRNRDFKDISMLSKAADTDVMSEAGSDHKYEMLSGIQYIHYLLACRWRSC